MFFDKNFGDPIFSQDTENNPMHRVLKPEDDE